MLYPEPGFGQDLIILNAFYLARTVILLGFAVALIGALTETTPSLTSAVILSPSMALGFLFLFLLFFLNTGFDV